MNIENAKNFIAEHKMALTLIVALAFIALNVGSAVAGTGGTQFDTIWQEISGWIDGTPGKIIALLAFGFAMFKVVQQDFIMAIGSFLAALLMANAVTIINGFLTAGVAI